MLSYGSYIYRGINQTQRKMDRKEAELLFQKYINGTCTAEEKLLFESLYLKIADLETVHKLDTYDLSEVRDRIYARLPQAEPLITQSVQTKIWPGSLGINIAVRWAAALLLLVGAGFWFAVNQIKTKEVQQIAIKHDIAPGKNTATLTLPGGEMISLSSDKNGVVIDAGALKYNDGSIIPAHQEMKQKAMSSISTPRGGMYQIMLSDGTKVWLNAESSLKFPVSFKGLSVREVELTGEAYFEVAKASVTRPDKTIIQQTFLVTTDRQKVNVLGTHFNINSYEPVVKTTLLEGSIQVTANDVGKKGHHQVIIKPGEQSLLSSNGITVSEADLEQAVDWKNGDFIFQKESLTEIMQKVARWYNVTVKYDDKVDVTQTFSGQVSRSRPVSALLNTLASTGQVKFTIEGNYIHVKN